DRTAIFWYQVDPALLNLTGRPIVQSGVIDPGAGGHLFFPSIAVNKDNDAVIGFSRSDADRYAEAAFASRSANNTAGAISQITVLKPGEASYSKGFGNGDIRWGDYSSTVVDPEDNTTFWTIQEYAATPAPGGTPNDDRWGTWWGQITPSYTVNTPPVADAGSDQNVQTGSVVTLDGSASYDIDGNPLTYQWSFTSKPAGSSAALTDPTAVKPAFTADINGSYILSLVVNDGTVNSAADSVTITAATASNSQSSSGGGGGGGGCTINPDAEFDPALLLLMLFAILGLYAHKKRKI
ncbi:MAG: JDVT-CTERM domain-containing protein, partial [Epsilonproteobacteria bacterium]|nr:JDVT-CTERM domain-containing protein [Campylobacterota bacterium]